MRRESPSKLRRGIFGARGCGLLLLAAAALAQSGAAQTSLQNLTSAFSYSTGLAVAPRGAAAQTAPENLTPAFSYSTYLGGEGFDYAYAVATDSFGNTYIAGDTNSANFPATGPVIGPGGGTCNGFPCPHVFVAKLNAMGSALVYSTILDGSNEDHATGIAVDSAGSAYVTGYTASTDFPIANAFQTSSAGGNCGTSNNPIPCFHAFLAKLDPSGAQLIYSTYLGGTGNDYAAGISLDSSGAAYVTGSTSSRDFPVTSGAVQTAFGGGSYNAFVTKLDSNGSTAVFSTYLGGSSEDHGAAIAVDMAGHAYVTGYTNSNNFPTANPLQGSLGGGTCGSIPCFDAFVAKLSAGGSALVYSTYLGGSGGDYGYGIAVDQEGAAYLTGLTTSTDFPLTPGALQAAGGGTNYNSFVTKINPDGSALAFSTYLGGTANVTGFGIAVDPSGNSYVTGQVYGPGFTTASPLQPAWDLLNDAFVAIVDAAGSELNFATYLGGSGNDVARGVALDMAGNVYVAGGTFSTDFPTTPGAFQSSFGGGAYNAFVTRIAFSAAPAVSFSSQSLTFGGQNVQIDSAPQTLVLTNYGTETLLITQVVVSGDFEDDNTCGASLAAGASCTLPVTFCPTATGMRTGTLTVTDNAAGSPHAVTLSGMGTAPAAAFSPTSLAFGDQGLTTISAPLVLHLSNSGTGPLVVQNVSASGDFDATNDCSGSLFPGAGYDISVVFTPTKLGPQSGSVSVSDNASQSPQSIQLSGSGVTAYCLTATPNSATVMKGASTASFSISASGSFGFAGAIALSCSDNAEANCNFSPASIVPGQSSTLTVGGLSALISDSLTFSVTGSSGSQSAPISLTVLLSDFALGASPASATMAAGQSATYTLKLSPINSFNQSLSVSCSGAPQAAACSVSPGTLALDGSHDVTATVTVTTTARSSPELPRRAPPCAPRGVWMFGWRNDLLIFAILAALLSAARRGKRFRIAPLGGALSLMLLLASCGGGGGGIGGSSPPEGTQPGTYILTITAGCSNGPSHNLSLTLVVD